VVSYCHEYYDKTGAVPSYSTIASALRIHDRATVRKYVVQAESRGLLSRSGVCTGGSGKTSGQRIRLGTPEEAAEGQQAIKLGSEVAG